MYCHAFLQEALLHLRGRRPNFSLVCQNAWEEDGKGWELSFLPVLCLQSEWCRDPFHRTTMQPWNNLCSPGLHFILCLWCQCPKSCPVPLSQYGKYRAVQNLALQNHKIVSSNCWLMVLPWCNKSKTSVLHFSVTSWMVWWHWLYVC